jgi:hypothetical protein
MLLQVGWQESWLQKLDEQLQPNRRLYSVERYVCKTSTLTSNLFCVICIHPFVHL